MTTHRRSAPSSPEGPDPARSETLPLADARTLLAPGDAAPTPEQLATLSERLPCVAREVYALGGEVASGGIGRVVRARDQRLDRPVALKGLLHRGEAQERRFVREALLTARLQHPAIVPIYEAGRWPDGEPFYAMKLVSGRSLADRIAERATLAERLALLPHVLTAAQAVAYAHSRRIIHRDLKPANVLIGEFGETVVIDWGLAKHIADDESFAAEPARAGAGLTIAGAVVGTPSYMPPEQARGESVDERADVYALGAMLYHLLAAAPPYHDAPWQLLLATIAERPPRPLEQQVPQVPDELAAIVHKAMARDPADRYRDARELAEDLERFQTGRIVAAHTYSARQLLARYWRRNRAALSVAAAALVSVALVTIAAFVKTDQQRRIAEDRQRDAVEASLAADAARRAAVVAEARATARADALTLAQAQDALRRDPNRALAWLKQLSPGFDDRVQLRRIAAEAQARGIARAFHGHTGYVSRFDVAPDGARLITASDDKTVRAWQLATGASLALAGHTDEVWNARFLADGERIASVSKDSTLRLWDARTGASLATVPVPAPTRQLVARADGALVGANAGGSAWIWRPGAAAVELLSPPEERPVWALASLDGGRVIVQPELGDVEVRDIDGPTRRRLPGTRGPPGRWFLDVRGELALHVAERSTALWDVAAGRRRALDGVVSSRRPVFSDDGELVAFAVGQDIHVHATRRAAPVQRLVGHEGPVQVLAFSADGERLVSGGVDRTIRTWHLASGQSDVQAGFDGIPTDVGVLADGRSIVAASTAGELRVFAPRRAGTIVTDHAAPTTGLALSSDGRVASVDDRGRLRIHALAGRAIGEYAVVRAPNIRLVAAPDGRRFAGVPLAWVSVADGRYPDAKAPPATLLLGGFDAAPRAIALPASALDLAWAPDGGAVVVALHDGTVRRIDGDGAARELGLFAAPATSVTFSADGAWLASGSEDGSVRLTETATGRHRELGRHAQRVMALALTADGAWLASGCADHTLRLWRPADGSFRSFDEGGHGVEQAAFTADGRALIFLSGGETELRRLDVTSGAPLEPLAGPGGKLLGFSMAADGRRLLTHGDDGAARLIDLADGGGRTLSGHTQPITGAGFAAGGRTLVTLGREGTVRVWPDDLPESMPELRAWIEAATPERIADAGGTAAPSR